MAGYTLNSKMKLWVPSKKIVSPTFGQIFVRTSLKKEDHQLIHLAIQSENYLFAGPIIEY